MNSIRVTLGLSLVALASVAMAQDATRKPYIVQLKDAPISTYTGGVTGYNATQPAPGSKLSITSGDVQNYISYLNQKQAAVTVTLPSAAVTYSYKTLINGFSALLTDAEFAKLVTNSAVKSITVDTPMPMATSYTPSFLGLKRVPEGVWNRTDASGRPIKGEGVIIGHLDGGVWPEDPSFSDKVDANGIPSSIGTVVYAPLPPGRWNGGCSAATAFSPANCNNKLIGAKYFNAILKSQIAIGARVLWTGDYLDSPRDADGHGTHTLSTSGGNENSPVLINGSPFSISGIAPRARVAAYKVCYVPQNAAGVPQQGSCYQGDSIAAAEAAVNDGVDIINFSVGGSTTSFNDAVESAFGNAAFAGVFVAASSGNSNVFPGNAPTAAHLAPWVMTVGNSTHDRFTEAAVSLGNGYVGVGASFQTTGLTSKALVYSRNVGFTPGTTTNQALCFGTADGSAALLDPAKVAGKILVCERGTNVLVNKVAAAKAAGALGVIILNTPASANTTPLISAELPTVHMAVSNYAALTAYMGDGSTPASASFSPSIQVAGIVAPVMSDSSSRGPNPADPNMLKPDITAPGTDIIAAYTNTSITPAQRQQIIDGTLVPGAGANMISGTSMAAPHVAGAAALLRQANPTWSPFAIKSALMTSAQPNVKLANAAADPSPWGFGAGHLSPNTALDTRVVYETTVADYVNYNNGVINGRTLNVASLTHANVVGIGSLTRRLTNKGTSTVTYNASGSLPGYTVAVSPTTLTIAPGATASYTVTMTRTTAPIEQWVFGNVTWSGSGVATLRSPLSAKASQFVGLSGVFDTRAVGTKIFTTAFGYDGALATSPLGLLAATRVSAGISLNQRLCTGGFVVAAGTKVLRSQLFNEETEGGSAADLDLVIQRQVSGVYTTVASSGNVDSNEMASVSNPVVGGTYRFCIDGYGPVRPGATFTMSYWILGPTNPGTLKAFAPTSVKTGGIASIGLNWNVPAGARYLGLVEFRDGVSATPIGVTQVFIDNWAATAPAPTYAPVARIKLLNLE
ncbi:MAG: S8 family serine peptidase [Pseudomonadota bacterium]